MKKENLKNYMSHFVLLVLFFVIIYAIGTSVFKDTLAEISDREVSVLVHEGRLEIEKELRETSRYATPIITNQKVYDLGYTPYFELKENGGYTYSVIMKTGIDEAYCVHEDGHAGRYINWGCELEYKI